MNDWNERVMAEFRASGGKVGGGFEGATMLILHTTGRRTGRDHATPLVYLPDGDRYVVFGSNGGAPRHPDWYLNLVADPQATIELGSQMLRVRASAVEDPERERLYARQVARRASFAEYPRKTTRVIPAVALQTV